MRWASFFGSVPVMIGISSAAALYFLRRKNYREALAAVAASLGAFFLETVLKEIFRRPRPPHAPPAEAYGYSFPSGHATVAAALFLVLAWLWYRRTRRRWPGPAGLLLTLLIGTSRIYLGAHYPSDVLAGFVLGIAWGLAVLLFLGRDYPTGGR